MILWMGAELDLDVYDAYRAVRLRLERDINALLESTTAPSAVEKWAYIAIIMHDEEGAPPFFTDVCKLHRKRKVAEFRLRVPHGAFLPATEDQRCGLILTSLIRSLESMNAIGVRDWDPSELIQGLLALGRRQKWISGPHPG